MAHPFKIAFAQHTHAIEDDTSRAVASKKNAKKHADDHVMIALDVDVVLAGISLLGQGLVASVTKKE